MNKFYKDLEIFYNKLSKEQEELNRYFEITENKKNYEASTLVNNFLKELKLPQNEESTLASLQYLINLREDNLISFMQNINLNQNEIDKKLELAYEFNSKLYLKRFKKLINYIKDKNLFTPFYQELIEGVHSIGEVITKWQSRWREHIINNINKELFELFKGDEDKIFQMLERKKLLDCKNGLIADRCYSVLINDNGEYKRLSYFEAFRDEVEEIIKRCDILINRLKELEDDIFNQKNHWIDYFKALKKAFLHKEVDELVELWANVDRVWMKITTPIQVGHPLEYYEDKYRKAVALEWDIRVINPSIQNSSNTKENIKNMAIKLANTLGKYAKEVIDNNLKQINNTQLYIGQPAFYYGAELNGLFSAQVVPNDEEVSRELGKKIFAYIDFVREAKKSKPIMQLAVNTFGIDFIKKQKDLINNNPSLWNKIYDISTIGHEFGHILWIDSDTEVAMNKSGQFKNIEEFKATTGGLMAFFENEDKNLKEYILDDIISRAINLMAWREITEVLPYYTEGLIHLELLYKSGVISFENKMVKINYNKYDIFKEVYKDAYRELAKNYLEKIDANEYLSKYTKKRDNIFLPKREEILKFVENYYKDYKEIGNIVAKEEFN